MSIFLESGIAIYLIKMNFLTINHNLSKVKKNVLEMYCAN